MSENPYVSKAMPHVPAQQSSLVPLQSVVETEKKLTVADDFKLPALSGDPLPRRVFKSTYFDTLDHCLARSSITLRRRHDKGSAVWQMKLPPLNGARREVELREASVTPPARFVDALVVLHEGKHLVPIAELRTSRTGVRVPDGKNNGVEVVLDTVAVLRKGSVIQQFKELEIESLNGDDECIERLASTLYGVGARPHDGRPKLFQALSSPTTHWTDKDASIVEHVRHRLMHSRWTLPTVRSWRALM